MVKRTVIVATVASMMAFSLSADEPPAGYRSLFNGKDLAGWEGNEKVWKVEAGMIVGDSPGLPNNEFLANKTTFQDFALRIKFRLVGGKGNSGVQFRSVRIPNHHEMIGYQADVGERYWGCLYDESRRRRVLVEPPAKLQEVLKKDQWNEYYIRCMNNNVLMQLADMTVVDYTEEDASIARSGLIAVQVHSSKEPLRVEFKDIFVQELPLAHADDEKSTGFLRRSAVGPDGKEFTYCLFLPEGYHANPDKQWPTIVFLHGSGESGNDGELPIKVGIGPAILARASTFPYLVVFPQSQEKTWKADSPDAERMLALIDQLRAKYRIDPKRVHLSGLSMGGSGAWSIGSAQPDRWASVSMLCASGEAGNAPKFAGIPVRLYCGDKDRMSTVESMRNIKQALADAKVSAQYVEYPGIPHNCWDLAYNDETLYRWMAAASR